MDKQAFDARRVDPRVRLVMRLLEFEQTVVPSLDDLARRVDLSPFRLAHLFAENLGESVAAYGRRIRLDNSIHQMIHDDVPLDGVAAAFGYRSQAAYTRAFTRQFGMSPRQYVATELGHTQRDFAASNLAPIARSIDTALIGTPVVLRRRPCQPALARRFYGFDVASHWRAFLEDLPPALAETGTLAIMGYDNARVTPARRWRVDCALAFDRLPIAWETRHTESGLDLVELPGGLHAELAVEDGLPGLWRASIGLLTEWLPSHRQYVPEGDPVVSWIDRPAGVIPTRGVATMRIRPRGTSPAYNLPPLMGGGRPAGERTDPSEV